MRRKNLLRQQRHAKLGANARFGSHTVYVWLLAARRANRAPIDVLHPPSKTRPIGA